MGVVEAHSANIAREASGETAMELPSSSEPPFESAEVKTRDFWFQVNAEVILYGATDPAASVELAGHPIALRSDGTFSVRFALPDGVHSITAKAQSADGVETRSARFELTRHTSHQGRVRACPIPS